MATGFVWSAPPWIFGQELRARRSSDEASKRRTEHLREVENVFHEGVSKTPVFRKIQVASPKCGHWKMAKEEQQNTPRAFLHFLPVFAYFQPLQFLFRSSSGPSTITAPFLPLLFHPLTML